MPNKVNTPDNFWGRVDKSGECWIWGGAVRSDGYGISSIKGKTTYAHRLAYTLVKGEIPEGLCLDHLCRNRRCVNPNHLEAVTGKINTYRGTSFAATNANKTHCESGHEFTLESTYLYKGKRKCKICLAVAKGKYRAKIKKGQD